MERDPDDPLLTRKAREGLEREKPDGYAHPKTLPEFESVYRQEYEQELASCDRWIKWCQERDDTHGMNFHQGLRSALVFHNIKMEQLLRTLKQESPSALKEIKL